MTADSLLLRRVADALRQRSVYARHIGFSRVAVQVTAVELLADWLESAAEGAEAAPADRYAVQFAAALIPPTDRGVRSDPEGEPGTTAPPAPTT